MKELESQGTRITSTSTNSSQQNSIRERRFGTIFAAARTALAASGLSRKVWSLACLDAIDKANFIPVQSRSGKSTSPNEGIKGEPQSEGHLLPFDQHGFVVDTILKKTKLEDRALRVRYLRATSETQYRVVNSRN